MAGQEQMQYRVYKANGTRCIRKFDTLDEAQGWCWTRDTGETYRIEWQYPDEGEPRRLYV